MIPFGQYGVEYENVTPAPKVGLGFFCTTICQGSAVRKVIYIYIYSAESIAMYLFLKKEFRIPQINSILKQPFFFWGGIPPPPPKKVYLAIEIAGREIKVLSLNQQKPEVLPPKPEKISTVCSTDSKPQGLTVADLAGNHLGHDAPEFPETLPVSREWRWFVVCCARLDDGFGPPCRRSDHGQVRVFFKGWHCMILYLLKFI